MSSLLEAGKTGELQEGTMKDVTVNGREILHGSQFDLVDGRVVRWLKGSGIVSAVGRALKSPRQLTTYNVNIEDGRILVEF